MKLCPKATKVGDLVYAPQDALLHTGGTTIKLEEPTLLLVAERKERLRRDSSTDDTFCPVMYKGTLWFALRKDLYKPRRNDGS